MHLYRLFPNVTEYIDDNNRRGSRRVLVAYRVDDRFFSTGSEVGKAGNGNEWRLMGTTLSIGPPIVSYRYLPLRTTVVIALIGYHDPVEIAQRAT
jgi:hypothetical protein